MNQQNVTTLKCAKQLRPPNVVIGCQKEKLFTLI